MRMRRGSSDSDGCGGCLSIILFAVLLTYCFSWVERLEKKLDRILAEQQRVAVQQRPAPQEKGVKP